jgi:hypothetical protein
MQSELGGLIAGKTSKSTDNLSYKKISQVVIRPRSFEKEELEVLERLIFRFHPFQINAP